MPELPEVETVRRTLSTKILGKRIDHITFIYPKTLKTDRNALDGIKEFSPIKNLDRRGKYLIFNFEDGSHFVIHLRMEGKLFYFPDEGKLDKHDTVIFSFMDGSSLHFNDVRKFGCLWFYKKGEELSCLDKLGKEANRLSATDVEKALKEKKDLPWKEFFLDQSIFAGIGNIYADEICFALKVNPFVPHKTSMSEEERENVVKTIKEILDNAIIHKGTTVKTFMSSQFTKGENQQFLKVYGREGKNCYLCGSKIEKRDLGGRGTSFCPKCQNVPDVVGITGGIASGKSTFAKYLAKETNSAYIDCDKEVKQMYEDKKALAELNKACKEAFKKGKLLNKNNLTNFLIQNKKGRHKFLTRLYSLLKERINLILNKNPTKSYVIEAPLLFEAHLDSLCFHIVMMETSKTKEHLLERGEKNIEEKLALGSTNKWKEHIKECDAVISSDGTLDELKKKADDFITDFDLIKND